MKIDKLMYYVKSNKIIVSSITIILLCSGYFFIHTKEEKYLQLLKDTYIVEYGNTIPTNCKEYLNFSNVENRIKEDIYKQAKVSINKKNQNDYPDIGKYVATIQYKKERVSFVIMVKDTTPPRFESLEDITITEGTVLSSKQIKDKFKVKDLQEVKVEIDQGGYDGNKIGKYTIKATARDASSNKARASYCLTVEKKSEENTSNKDDLPVVIDDNKNKEGVAEKEPLYWWGSLSDQMIKDKVIASLVWKNEWTDKVYYGVEGLTYGFNIEDKAYGGLLLVKNPYNVQIDFGFYGGPYCQTYTNTFTLYWQAPKGHGREVNCGNMEIMIPKAITGEELYEYYQ